MGVTGLWNIVTPLSKVLTLSELQGKTIAVDLSCWIVDSQNVAPTDGCPKRYLRYQRINHEFLFIIKELI